MTDRFSRQPNESPKNDAEELAILNPWHITYRHCEDLYGPQRDRLAPAYPGVERFADLLVHRGALRVVDVGSGAGRHAIRLSARGFEVTALDISPQGLELGRRLERLHAPPPRIAWVEGSLETYGEGDEAFDGLLSVGVIHHATPHAFIERLEKLRSLLSGNGVAFVTLPSIEDPRYGRGREIAERCFVSDSGPEAGVPHLFADSKDIERYFHRFPYTSVRTSRLAGDGMTVVHWVVVAGRGTDFDW